MTALANSIRGSLAALLAAVALLIAVPGIADAAPNDNGGGGGPVKCQTADGLVDPGDEVTVVIRDRKGKVVYKKTSICGKDGKMHEVMAIGAVRKGRGYVATTTVKSAR
jgi:hypothetical protein